MDVTLSPDEVQFFLNELAGRDPLMRMLLQKQQQAQTQQAAGPRLVRDEPPVGVSGGVA